MARGDAAGGNAVRGVVVGSLLIAVLLVAWVWTRAFDGPTDEPDEDPEVAETADEEAEEAEDALHVEADAPPPWDGSEERPYATIQRALVDARPGDAVLVGPGTYEEEVRSVRSGLPGAPIRLVGDDATIRGDEDVNHLVAIDHDDIEIRGFTITEASTLVHIHEAERVRVLDNHLHEAEGECLRLRYRAVDNEVAGNRIEDCGQEDFDLDEDDKNGEAIYVGTALGQLEDNPTDEPDRSNGNHIHGNELMPRSECVDVKEYAVGNVVEDNACTGGEDPVGGGLRNRGIATVIRDNVSTGHAGSGLRLGGEDEDDTGIRAVVHGNRLADNGGYGLEVRSGPHDLICGNDVADNDEGATNDDDIDPTVPCDG